jgi:Kynureninase
MNSLTVNLHLMMATFYRPTKSRFKVLMEEPAFPSDTYAIKTQLIHHGLDPKDALVLARPRKGEFTVRTEDILDLIESTPDHLAVVIMGAVNFFTGQLVDIEKVTAAARNTESSSGSISHTPPATCRSRCMNGMSISPCGVHTNIERGPGAVAGAFVHERHATNTKLPRLAGWFGNDPNTRFRLHLEPEFVPVASADGWQISNPPIFSMAPLRASLSIFHEAGGMEPLRAKSMNLPAISNFDRTNSVQRNSRSSLQLTRMRAARNCRSRRTSIQSSYTKNSSPRCEMRFSRAERDPRRATPLYNTFHEVWRFAQILAAHK